MFFIISGHLYLGSKPDTISSHFYTPQGVTLIYYAKQNETCFLGNTPEEITHAVNDMNTNPINYDRETTGSITENYIITFTDGVPVHGLFRIDNNAFTPVLSNNTFSLDYILQFAIANNLDGSPIYIFCIFCRGESDPLDAFSSHIDTDDDDKMQQLFLEEEDLSYPGFGGKIKKSKKSKKTKKTKKSKKSKKSKKTKKTKKSRKTKPNTLP